MELHFPDGVDINLGHGCEIELPFYVKKLPQEAISNLLKSSEKDHLVIAAGADPRDNKVTLLTATNRVLVFDAPKYYIPAGPALPCADGNKIFFPNLNGRWPGPSKGFYANSSWVIGKSYSALVGATLHTNYRDEDKSKDVEALDTRRG